MPNQGQPHPEHSSTYQEQPRPEHSSTYFVEDRSNREELARLQVLDHLFTAGMNGVLSEQPAPSTFGRVLDVGCGTGGWLVELAQASPSTSLLIGVDPSRTLVEYARTRAEAAQVSDRVEFHVMDALSMLEFPTGFFDLVNQRAGWSWLRTWDWPKLLQEYQRVCRPGGVIRITESDMWQGTSPAMMRLIALFEKALYQAGHLFRPTSDGVNCDLARVLSQHGVRNVQTRSYTISHRADTPEGQHFCKVIQLSYQTIVPFLRKWTRVPDDYEAIYQQMLAQMQQPDFVASMRLLTAWGTA
ncbi:MAG TPA: methyltransferase domain-containing protein [Ktedonobacteraceae bacterium]|jgi:ubiquinone/menaquinone biosynthesis C-methylase UbiE